MNARNHLVILTFSLLCVLYPTRGVAVELVSTVGDADGLGFAIPDAGMVPVPGLFDNRSPTEMAATNGAQLTDSATSTSTSLGSGVFVDSVDIVHSFSIPRNATIQSASIIFGIGGLQENDNDPGTDNILEDELLLDGVIIPEAFEPLVQSSREFDADYTIELSPDFFPALIDGNAVININTNALAGAVLDSEPVYLDYSQIVVNFSVTEVPALNPFSVSILGLLFVIIAASQLRNGRRYKSRKT